MTVGDTLEFAARLRTPQNRGDNIDRETYAKRMADAYMATYGISHTRNTKVGNDIVRGLWWRTETCLHCRSLTKWR